MAKPLDRSNPTISCVLSDGTMVEAVHDAAGGSAALAVRSITGSISIEPYLDLGTGERLVPYAADNNLLSSGCVLLASDVGAFTDKQSLLADIRAFIRRYVDLREAGEAIAAHYVLLSWVYDAFNELPYLRFQGEFGTGKTRALLAVGSICYKPFFASGASTVSPLFHVLDAFEGTLVLDEADFRFSDATADLTKILNNGSMKGLPVLRTMTNRHRELNPQAFKVYGPKIIAMRRSFADEALESRFLTETMGNRPPRRDIPISLPDELRREALQLRNRLLAWRFAARNTVAIDASKRIEQLSPRGNQMALPLLSIIDDEQLRSEVATDLVAGEARVAIKRAAAPTATMVRTLHELIQTGATPHISIAALTAAYNEKMKALGEYPLSAKAVGSIARAKLGLETTKTGGVYVIPHGERRKIRALADRERETKTEPPVGDVTVGFPARSAAYASDA